jgi:hypothetical protein
MCVLVYVCVCACAYSSSPLVHGNHVTVKVRKRRAERGCVNLLRPAHRFQNPLAVAQHEAEVRGLAVRHDVGLVTWTVSAVINRRLRPYALPALSHGWTIPAVIIQCFDAQQLRGVKRPALPCARAPGSAACSPAVNGPPRRWGHLSKEKGKLFFNKKHFTVFRFGDIFTCMARPASSHLCAPLSTGRPHTALPPPRVPPPHAPGGVQGGERGGV